MCCNFENVHLDESVTLPCARSIFHIIIQNYRTHSLSNSVRSLSICRKRTDCGQLKWKGQYKTRAYIFLSTILQVPALCPTEARELSGSDPRVGSFWQEPVLRIRAFHLRGPIIVWRLGGFRPFGSRIADISSFSWRFAVDKSWYGDGKSLLFGSVFGFYSLSWTNCGVGSSCVRMNWSVTTVHRHAG